MRVQTLPLLNGALVLGDETIDLLLVGPIVPNSRFHLSGMQVGKDREGLLDVLLAVSVYSHDLPDVEACSFHSGSSTSGWAGEKDPRVLAYPQRFLGKLADHRTKRP